ncbi:MAG: extracellular solute-binding protein [Chloroflexi bacterium]|nr:extracellular solute-binding protein [Chloroflexota bacterium]
MSLKRNLSRREFLRATAFSTVGLALAACAAPAAPASAPAATSGESAAAAPAAAEKVTVRFHARIGQQEDTLYDMQIPKFMEENPNIEIVKESFPGAEFSTKISTMMAGGTLGDVIWSALGQSKIQFAYSQNQIAAVNDLAASGGVDLSQWYQGCLDAITVEGNLLGLPFKAHPGLAIIYYNQNILDEAGAEYPTEATTIAQQVEIAKAATKKEGDRTVQFGYLPGVSWKSHVSLFRAFGTELINEDGSVCQLNSELGMQAINHLYDLFHTHQVAPTPDQMLGSGNEMWISGILGQFQGGTSVSVTGGSIGDKFAWMVAPNAVGPGGVGGSDFEVDAYCVTTATKHAPEAFEWVQYLCSKDSGIQLGLIGGTVGGRPDVYGAPELLAFPFRVVFQDVMDNAMDSRILDNWRQEEAEKTFAQLTQPLWAGDEQPTQAFIDGVTAQIQDIMDKPRP